MFVRAAVAAILLSLGVAATPAHAVAGPTVTPKWTTHNQARVDWTSIPGAPYYRVTYSLDPLVATGVTKKVATSSPIVLSSLQSNTTYYVRVQAISASSAPLSDPSAIKSFTTKPPPVNVVVGSFNIKDPDSSDATAWNTRRRYIASDIQAGYLDVLGTQEAYEDNDRQELLDSVNAAGTRDYTMIPDLNDNEAWDNRILYQHAKVELIGPVGIHTYKSQATTDRSKYRKLVYATFWKSGKSFVFVTTHLAPGNGAVSQRQWGELLWVVQNRNPNNYPVIIVGDFNSTKFGAEACVMVPKMRAAGYGDVLGQQCRSYTPYQQRAVQKIYANVNSFNGLNPRIADYSVSAGRIGNNVDWIFASNHLKVPRWQTHVTQSGGRLTWPIRSDHFMVSSIVTLP